MTMRKLSVTALIILLTGLVALGQSRREQEVLQLSHAKFKWLVQKKLDSLKVVLDERLSYIHSNGWMQTKNELIADLMSGKLTYESIDIVKDSIRIYPKSAVVTGRGKFVATMGGATNTYDLTYTETYVLQKREWKLVSRHASRAQ
jgi:Domain of unknown function (DUF4440)